MFRVKCKCGCEYTTIVFHINCPRCNGGQFICDLEPTYHNNFRCKRCGEYSRVRKICSGLPEGLSLLT